MDGRDALDLRNFFTGSVGEGLGTLVVAEECVLTDLGDPGGEGVEFDVITGCQRSKTDDFLGARDLLVGETGAGLSSCELILTIFWTNPRPCNRLMLGVTSFGVGDFINAGDGRIDAGIMLV